MSYNYLFKFIIVGDPSIGKSSIMLKFTDDKFNTNYDTTIGVEYGSKIININNINIILQIWDTAGQEIFSNQYRAYYRSTAGVLLVYDITNKNTFNNVKKWLKEINEYADNYTVITLIGNKTDLDEKRQTIITMLTYLQRK